MKSWQNVGSGSEDVLYDIGHRTLAKQTSVGDKGEGIFRSGGGEGLVTITYGLAALERHGPVAVKVAQITIGYFCRIKFCTTVDVQGQWEHSVP